MLADKSTPFLTPEGALVFTLTNNGYKFLTYNLVCHLRIRKVPWKLCIICTDHGSFRFFRSMEVPCIRLQTLLPEFGTEISPFGTKHFQTLNLKKLELLSFFSSDPAIRYGIYMDGDIVVYSDFLPDIIQRLSAPSATKIYLQCDEQSRVDCSGNPHCNNVCTGFLAWSHGIDTRIFKVDTTTINIWKSRPEDQIFVNTMIHHYNIPIMTLPRTLYPNGMFANFYSKESLRKKDSFLLHYNYLVGSSKQKKIQQNGDWIIPY
jgi:hypothetical protein